MCKVVEPDTSKLHCDHVEPHGGDPDKFWVGPFQTLCAHCHNSTKQAAERAGRQASYRPKWLKPSLIPVTLICGPPASGKTTYARAHAGPDDLVVDLDAIVAELSGGPMHGWSRERWLHPALFKRNDILGSLSRPSAYAHCWLIISAAKPEHRQWWADTLRNASIIVLETPEAECIRRAATDPSRDPKATADAIASWWWNYGRRPGDTVIAA